MRAQNDLMGRDLAGVGSRSARASAQIEITPKKLKPQDLMVFSRQMAAFLRAGIPILDALEMLSDDASNKQLQQVLIEVDRCAACRVAPSPTRWRAHVKLFPSYYVSILRSAELTGNLDVVLEQLADYIERDLETTRAIKSALIYPIVILVMSIGTVILLVSYVLAEVQDVLRRASTRSCRSRPGCCSRVGDFFDEYGLVVLGVVGRDARLPGRLPPDRAREAMARDSLLLTTPAREGRHPVRRRRALLSDPRRDAQGRRAGARSDDRGARSDEQPRVPGSALERARRHASWRGHLPADRRDPPLPQPAAQKMLLVGEQSGTLDTQLDATAAYCEGERTYRLKRLTTLFEPVVIVIMGVHRRLRRHRAGVGDVRHLQPGERLSSACGQSVIGDPGLQ